MRRIKFLMTALCLCLLTFTGRNVFAEEIYVYDQADLLNEEEEQSLEELAIQLRDNWNMNFLVVTTDDANGKSSRDYADDFYDERFPEDAQEDGVLFLIDMDHREIYLSTCGQAIRYLTDSRIDNILDRAYEEVADGDYYGTFVTFFDRTEYYLKQGIPSDQYNYDTETGERDYYYDSHKEPKSITPVEGIIAVAAAVAAAAVACGVIIGKYQLKFEDFHYDAYTDCEVRLSVNEDRLVNSFVTHRRIPRNDGNHSGGGSRSSTHHSSSGRSHGGGGRSF